MTDLPVACTLLEAERQRRRSGVLERVFARVREERPLDDGYALRFDADEGHFAELLELIQLERQCCPFLKFRLTVEPGGGPVWLELTGPGRSRFSNRTWGWVLQRARRRGHRDRPESALVPSLLCTRSAR